MEVKNKQNIVLIAVIIVIVLVFSISNRIKQKQVYVLSDGAKENINKYESNGHINNNNNINEIDEQYSKGKIIVHIEGEVVKPGVYELNGSSRVFDAIDMAGGLLEGADRKRINLAKKIVDEEYIYIPNKNDENAQLEYRGNLLTPTENIENINLINVNKANIMELKELPGIGDVLAGRIIDYRDQNGEFKSIEQLKEVSGIGDKKFSDIKDKVTVK